MRELHCKPVVGQLCSQKNTWRIILSHCLKSQPTVLFHKEWQYHVLSCPLVSPLSPLLMDYSESQQVGFPHQTDDVWYKMTLSVGVTTKVIRVTVLFTGKKRIRERGYIKQQPSYITRHGKHVIWHGIEACPGRPFVKRYYSMRDTHKKKHRSFVCVCEPGYETELHAHACT